MKTHIRRRQDNKELIIVYGSWGIDQNAFLPLCTDDHDLILYYNYSADEPLILPEPKTYDKIILIGWSLGVWAAEYFSSSMNIQPDLAIAINGTPVPADDKYGIPLRVFEGTLNNISPYSMRKFNLRLFNNRANLEQNLDKLSKRSIKSLEEELRWLYNRIMETPEKKIQWDISMTSNIDRIFPPKNLSSYWKMQGKTKHIEMNLPHYPFHQWNDFREMISFLRNFQHIK